MDILTFGRSIRICFNGVTMVMLGPCRGEREKRGSTCMIIYWDLRLGPGLGVSKFILCGYLGLHHITLLILRNIAVYESLVLRTVP